ncbi:hypothetical protein RYX36_007564, partial [Vicia faba]
WKYETTENSVATFESSKTSKRSAQTSMSNSSTSSKRLAARLRSRTDRPEQ